MGTVGAVASLKERAVCLQWCHVQNWLINNDVVCTGCEYRDPQRLPTPFSCQTCTHRIGQAETAGMCELTREHLPVIGRCCHWNAATCSVITLVLKTADLAPWMDASRGIVGVFDESDTAPDVMIDAEQQVVVNLDDLSIPLVYGVPSPNWDAAIGFEPMQPTSALPTQPAPDVDTLVEALGCIEQGGSALVTALEALQGTLHPDATVCRDATWRPYVISLIELCREHHGTEFPIVKLVKHLEDVVCI